MLCKRRQRWQLQTALVAGRGDDNGGGGGSSIRWADNVGVAAVGPPNAITTVAAITILLLQPNRLLRSLRHSADVRGKWGEVCA